MHKHRTTLILLSLGGAFGILAVAPALLNWSGSALGAACGSAPDSMWRLWSNHTGSFGAGFPAATPDLPSAAPTIEILFHGLASIFGGAIAAWNSMMLIGFACLTMGSIALAKRLSPDAPLLAYITFILTVVGSAAWTPLIQTIGIEILPIMLVPAVLALIHKWIEPSTPLWVGVSASLLFICSVLGHWSGTVFVISMTIPMAIVMTRHWEGAQARNRTLFALVPGLVLGAAHVYTTASQIGGLTVPAASLAPAWVTQSAGALVLPATAAVALPSLGILILALAGIAARPKDSAGWLLAATWGILLAAGTQPESAQNFLPAPHMMKLFPSLGGIESWWAIAPLVSIPLAVAAMRGVSALNKVQREKLAMGVLILALVDQTIPSTRSIGPRATSPQLGQETLTGLSNLPPGAVLQLPVDLNQCDQAAEHRLWQPLHGRAVSTALPNGPDGGLRVSYLARLTQRPMERIFADRPKTKPLGADAFKCAKADLKTLHNFGFSALLLDNRTGENEVAADILRQAVGPAISDDGGILLWSIEDGLNPIAPDPCPLPLLRAKG